MDGGRSYSIEWRFVLMVEGKIKSIIGEGCR
jgi:hypothetical protein